MVFSPWETWIDFPASGMNPSRRLSSLQARHLNHYTHEIRHAKQVEVQVQYISSLILFHDHGRGDTDKPPSHYMSKKQRVVQVPRQSSINVSNRTIRSLDEVGSGGMGMFTKRSTCRQGWIQQGQLAQPAFRRSWPNIVSENLTKND